jgi:proteic killer suppression protein
MSIKGFANQATEDIFFKRNTAKARRQVEKQFWGMAQMLLLLLNQAEKMSELQQTPGLRLEPIKHNMPGFHSIRVNNRYRIIFQWKDGDAYNVSVEDPKYHQP